MLRSVSAPWDFFFPMTHSGVIDVNPDRQTATARWQVQEIARSPDGSQSYDNVAIYYDRLARTDDGHGVLPNAAMTTSGSAALTPGAAPVRHADTPA